MNETKKVTDAEEGISILSEMDKEELVKIIIDDAKNWLAHDGLWFQSIEKDFGIEAAIKADTEAWEKFTVVEAKRIMERLGIKPGGGIPALVECLKHRLYARLNKQKVVEQSPAVVTVSGTCGRSAAVPNRIVFQMTDCRVQSARKRKGLPDFPCKSVGIVEYVEFARAIDPRIETRCIACPPDKHPQDYWCSWEFTLKE
ncbi:MAG: hypothetical protein HY746_05615 [Elusimicrobia bacterium]|nr:hypothetical protein [Elusimicrobiota bacterium]